jgi:putative two-component system response regulator
VLIVDDDPAIRHYCRKALELKGCQCVEAGDGESALELARGTEFDLVVLDLNMPGIDGFEVCRRLRLGRPAPGPQILIVSGSGDQNQLAEVLTKGADDYIPKPFEIKQLVHKAEHALRRRAGHEQAGRLVRELVLTNRQLENSLAARTQDVRLAQDALLFAMAKMADSRDGETPGHLRRLQRYTQCLALAAAEDPTWGEIVRPSFLLLLERCVPLHDIGKIGLPDSRYCSSQAPSSHTSAR